MAKEMTFSVAQEYLDNSFQISREEPNLYLVYFDFFFPLWHCVMHKKRLEEIWKSLF